ncbi:uncharacterized protein LOC129883589 [Solanum dulcamara]|uniref:uncharacterized protein LOC129883589 n=1 Tax=Solanum dulcamara TaxID=45834 RepID=UPI0024851C2D|nr:uncharacterized protein LOC129883589 [Solanum dulcamara]
MAIKLIVGGSTLNIINTYASRPGRGVEEEPLGGFDFGDRNKGVISLMEFARVFGLMVANSSFPKEEHLITFRSSVAKTQIDSLLFRKGDKGLYKDCKVNLSENLSTQHKLFVMGLEIKKERKKRVVDDRPRIKWGSFTMASVPEIEDRGEVDGYGGLGE